MITKKRKKTVVIVPIKSRSKRVKNKNFKLVNKKPLYTYLLSKLKLRKSIEIITKTPSKMTLRKGWFRSPNSLRYPQTEGRDRLTR